MHLFEDVERLEPSVGRAIHSPASPRPSGKRTTTRSVGAVRTAAAWVVAPVGRFFAAMIARVDEETVRRHAQCWGAAIGADSVGGRPHRAAPRSEGPEHGSSLARAMVPPCALERLGRKAEGPRAVTVTGQGLGANRRAGQPSSDPVPCSAFPDSTEPA